MDGLKLRIKQLQSQIDAEEINAYWQINIELTKWHDSAINLND